MASLEGIRSPFPAQLSPGSPKLCIYEILFLFNKDVEHIVALLRKMKKFSFADKKSMQSALTDIQEIRAGVNADFVEHLGERERFDEGRFWKHRRAIEKTLRDPDDVYIEVESREKERKKQGLPPRVGVLPHAAVSGEEQRWEALHERKKKRKRRHRAKSTGREKDHD